MPRQRREQEILDVAGAVFARVGYDPASMHEIAELAGVSKPLVYAYFDSKEGLYQAYLERAGHDLVERIETAVPKQHATGGALGARITEFLAFVEEHGDGWRVLFREVASTRPFAEQVAELRERIAQAIQRLIDASSPDYPSPASDAVAHALVGAGESLANWWLDHPEIARDEVADWYLAVVQAVMKIPPTPPGARGTRGY